MSNINMRDTKNLKPYLMKYYESISRGVNECVETDRLLREELNENGLEALSPRDLVALVKCLVNDKKRSNEKLGA